MIDDFSLVMLYQYLLNLSDTAEFKYRDALDRCSGWKRCTPQQLADALVAKIQLDTINTICHDIRALFRL